MSDRTVRELQDACFNAGKEIFEIIREFQSTQGVDVRGLELQYDDLGFLCHVSVEVKI